MNLAAAASAYTDTVLSAIIPLGIVAAVALACILIVWTLVRR